MALELKPTYIANQAWLESLAAGFLGFMLIGAYPMVFLLIDDEKTNHIVAQYAFWAWLILVLSIVLPMWAYVFLKRNNYKQTSYKFDNEKLAYYEGFLNIQRKEIFYKRVVEINLSKNVIQRIFGVGTVILSTAATGEGASVARSGIKLRDLANPDDCYEKIKTLVHGATR